MHRHHQPSHPSVTSYQTAGLLTSVFFLFIVQQCFITTVNAIDCFKCVSVNGANPACEDPFHNNFTSDLLESPCLGGRKGRSGLFPATACLKLAGRYADGNYEKMVIRTCALDSGTLTLDTELVRMSHCGSFVLDGSWGLDISIHIGRLGPLVPSFGGMQPIHLNDTGETIVVRGCALDSGTTTIDTEIIRMSHCGGLYFDDRYVNGCLQSCDDGDGCNRASADRSNWLRMAAASATFSLIFSYRIPFHIIR